MRPPKIGSTRQPFPPSRPEIAVCPSRARPFILSGCRLPGWGVRLAVGADNWMSWYDPPDWRLTSVSYQRVARPAEVHGLACLEIEMLEWEPGGRWTAGYTHYARLTATTFQWLAVSHLREGRRILYTFLDEGFDRDWGESARFIEDTGRLVTGEDGTYTLAGPFADSRHDCVGAGMHRVRIGHKAFTCLRVLELNARAGTDGPLEEDILAESFYALSGGLVLFRRYNGRLWRTRKGSPYAGRPWDERFPDNRCLVLNGAVFVHWYDCLTGAGCGIDAPRRRSADR